MGMVIWNQKKNGNERAYWILHGKNNKRRYVENAPECNAFWYVKSGYFFLYEMYIVAVSAKYSSLL
jgi:hypothetical protein